MLPWPLAYIPAEQDMQEAAPAAEYQPRWQGSQAVIAERPVSVE